MSAEVALEILTKGGVGALAVLALIWLGKRFVERTESGQKEIVSAIKDSSREMRVNVRDIVQAQSELSQSLVEAMGDLTQRVSRIEGQISSIAVSVQSDVVREDPTPIGRIPTSTTSPFNHDDDITPVERRVPRNLPRIPTERPREISQPYGPSKPRNPR